MRSDGQGQIKWSMSANNNTSASAKSRQITCGSSNSISRKLPSGRTGSRKWRKPAALPCALNECHAVDENGNGNVNDNAASGTGGGNDESYEQQQQQQNGANDDAEAGVANGPPIKTVESTLKGYRQPPRLSQHFGGGVPKETDSQLDSDDGGDDVDDGGGGGGGLNGVSSDADSQDESDVDGDGDDKDKGTKTGNRARGKEIKRENEEEEEEEEKAAAAGETKRRVRHIHPCICDLSTKAQARIKAHIRARELFELRHTQRLESIDAELRAIEEEIARKQQEEQEQEELFGDKYEVVGKKKKRMKRSARRASMVSLGVKQVINWKKSPKIKVRHNQASNLRKNYTAYCGDRPMEMPEIKKMAYGQSPKLAVRVTKAASLRSEANIKKRQYYIDNEDHRPIFDTSPYY